MKLKIYQVDAFTSELFSGNPAAIVPLDDWLPDELMQAIALENNLSETAFFVLEEGVYRIRWFTPAREVDLCGHATLAAAYIVFKHFERSNKHIVFNSLSGPLTVTRDADLLTLDFPCQPPIICDPPPALIAAIGQQPLECLKSIDYMVVLESEEMLAAITPSPKDLSALDLRGVIVTAPSDRYDFVARFFAPKFAVAEDPVTGSAYTQLTPYWSKKLGKSVLSARQISSRGGDLHCELKGDRVFISGAAVLYLEGVIEI